MNSEVVFGLEGAAWPALLANARGTLLRSNPAATMAFGAPLTGDSPNLQAIWSPDNPMKLEEFFVQWEKTPTPTGILKFRTANGETRKFVVAICVFGKDGKKMFVLQLLPADEPVAGSRMPAPNPAPPPGVSAETKSGPLDHSSVVLKQRLDCALQLARTISLDFNNALTSVLGHTSFLLTKAEAGHPWRHSLMEVEKSAARAAEIANELQTFSRQEKETPKAPPGNLNTVTTRCVEFFRSVHGEKIAWNIQLENGLFSARFDEAKVQQALTKILENAVEAVGAVGKGQITVKTRNVDLGEPMQDRNVRLSVGAYVCVEISDNGSGIEVDLLPRIFEPFFTTKGKAHRGLGLALAYGIVTNHGGGVAVSSEPGSGATARIYLPAENKLARESVSETTDLHGTGTILVVDDEDLLLTMGETILTEYGYKVLTANGGQKALAILSRDDTPVDMVVTDLVMPGMGGRELVERIRQLSSKIKILCASGYVMPADKQMGLAYLQKPYTSQELLAKIKNVLASESID
jgi:nitrogen-specific signal transduction histidine kinase/CheY-like chemotaxis protein